MGGLLRIFLMLGFFVKFWWLILLLLAAAGAGVVLWCFVTRQDAELERQHRQRAALVARADEQHAQILAGDERGLYGIYPPAVPPDPPPIPERLPRAGENWADYLAEQRRKALAGEYRGVHGDYPPAAL